MVVRRAHCSEKVSVLFLLLLLLLHEEDYFFFVLGDEKTMLSKVFAHSELLAADSSTSKTS